MATTTATTAATKRIGEKSPTAAEEPARGEPVKVQVVRHLPHPPRRVWRALTRPEAIDRWLLPIDGGAPDAGLAAPGEAVTLRGDPRTRVRTTVIEAEPERRLTLSWQVSTAPDVPGANVAHPTDTRVTWTLAPEQDGAATLLILEHSAADVALHSTCSGPAPLGGAADRLCAYLDITLGYLGRRRRQQRKTICRSYRMSSNRTPAGSAGTISIRACSRTESSSSAHRSTTMSRMC
jgi:uncharacterized protein YndB with AHSA1/START domain